jgi:hypothetical protein
MPLNRGRGPAFVRETFPLLAASFEINISDQRRRQAVSFYFHVVPRKIAQYWISGLDSDDRLTRGQT